MKALQHDHAWASWHFPGVLPREGTKLVQKPRPCCDSEERRAKREDKISPFLSALSCQWRSRTLETDFLCCVNSAQFPSPAPAGSILVLPRPRPCCKMTLTNEGSRAKKSNLCPISICLIHQAAGAEGSWSSRERRTEHPSTQQTGRERARAGED